MPEREPHAEQEYQKRERVFGEVKTQYLALARKLHGQEESVRQSFDLLLQDIEGSISQLADAEGDLLSGDRTAQARVDQLKSDTDDSLRIFREAVRRVEETPTDVEQEDHDAYPNLLTDRETLFQQLDTFIDSATDAEERRQAQEIRQHLLAVGITKQEKDVRLQELTAADANATMLQAVTQIGQEKRMEVQRIRGEFRTLGLERRAERARKSRASRGEEARRQVEQKLGHETLERGDVERRIRGELSRALERVIDRLDGGKELSDSELERESVALAWKLVELPSVPPEKLSDVHLAGDDDRRFQDVFPSVAETVRAAQEQLFQEAEALVASKAPKLEGWKKGKAIAKQFAVQAARYGGAGFLGGIVGVSALRSIDIVLASRKEKKERAAAQHTVAQGYRENEGARKQFLTTVTDALVTTHREQAQEDTATITIDGETRSIRETREYIAKQPEEKHQGLIAEFRTALRPRIAEIVLALDAAGGTPQQREATTALYEMNQMNRLHEEIARQRLQQGTATAFNTFLDKFSLWRRTDRVKNAAMMTALGIVAREIPGLRGLLFGLGGAELVDTFTRKKEQQRGGALLGSLRGTSEELQRLPDPAEAASRIRDVAAQMGEARAYLASETGRKDQNALALRRTLQEMENMVVALSALQTGVDSLRTIVQEKAREAGEVAVESKRSRENRRALRRVAGFAAGAVLGEGGSSLLQYLSSEESGSTSFTEWWEKVKGRWTGENLKRVAFGKSYDWFSRGSMPPVEVAAGAGVVTAEAGPPAPEPEPSPQPERGSLPEEAQHERPELLRRERTADVGGKVPEQWLGTKEDEPLQLENVEGADGEIHFACAAEAREFMDRLGLRVDERQGLIVLKGRNDIFFALDENRDGTIDTTQMKIDLVTRNFGSGEYRYLQIEFVDHPDDDGIANLQRFFVEADGKHAGEYLAKFEGDVLHDNASEEVRRLAEHGTVTERVDVNGDEKVDEITQLNIHKYNKGGEEFWVESHAGARGADGTEYRLDIDDADSDGDIDVYDVEKSGMYDVVAVADDGTVTSVGTYDAVGSEHFSYEEIAAGDKAILDGDSDFGTIDDPDARVDATRDVMSRLNSAGDKFGYRDGTLAVWDGKHVQIESFQIAGATVAESGGELTVTWNDASESPHTETATLAYGSDGWKVGDKTLGTFRGDMLDKMFEGKYPFMADHPDAAGLLLDRVEQELAMKDGVEELTVQQVADFFGKDAGALDPILAVCREGGASGELLKERLVYAIANPSETANALDRLFERTEGIEQKLEVNLAYADVKQRFNPAHFVGEGAPVIRLDQGDGRMIATLGSGTERHSYLFTSGFVRAVDASDLAHPGPAVSFDANNLTDLTRLEAALQAAKEQFTEARAAEHLVLGQVDDAVEASSWNDFGKDNANILEILRAGGIIDEQNVMRADFLQGHPDGMNLSVRELLHLSLAERPDVASGLLDSAADDAVAKDVLEEGVGKGWFERDLPQAAVPEIENMSVVDYRRMSPEQWAQAIIDRSGVGQKMHDNLVDVHAFLETKELPTQEGLNEMPETERTALHIGDLLHKPAREALFSDVPAPKALESHNFATFDATGKTFTLSTPEGLKLTEVALPENVHITSQVGNVVTFEGETGGTKWELVGTMKPSADRTDVLFTPVAPGSADRSLADVVREVAEAAKTAAAASTP